MNLTIFSNASVNTLIQAAFMISIIKIITCADVDTMDMESFLEYLLSKDYGYDKRVRPYYFNESCKLLIFFKRFHKPTSHSLDKLKMRLL